MSQSLFAPPLRRVVVCGTVREPALMAVIDGACKLGVMVRADSLDDETPARFDGVSITLNRDFDQVELALYLAHSVGSIVQWSIDPGGVGSMFKELRATKCNRADSSQFYRALYAFRAFEERSAEYGCGFLTLCEYESLHRVYSEFFRADLEAITIFHRTGHLPSWPTFFGQWCDELADGTRPHRPFVPRAIPPFEPRQVETQDVKQAL